MSARRDNNNNVHRRIAEGTRNAVLDVCGPTIEFLTSPDDEHDEFRVMRGVIPPGAVIPLHSHDDPEDFYIVAGARQFLVQGPEGPGKFFQEAARPLTRPPWPPTPDEIGRVSAIAAKYGSWLGSLEDNAVVGIGMPKVRRRVDLSGQVREHRG
jgi:hypothetical protein